MIAVSNLSQQKISKPCVFNGWHLANGISELNGP